MSTENLLLLGLHNEPVGVEFLITLGLDADGTPPAPVTPGTVLFKRNANIYVSKETEFVSMNSTNTTFFNVKDFSFNQRGIISEASRNTLDPNETRGINPYLAELLPAEFSFTTYIQPILDTVVTSPDEHLWVSLMGLDSISAGSLNYSVNFVDGNVPTLHNLTFYVDQPDHPVGGFVIQNAVIDSATISLDINQIASINWTGRGIALENSTGVIPITFTDRTNVQTYIKNKPTTLTLTTATDIYNLALIGGSVTIQNNNVFYGRNILGETKQYTGSYTGKRIISGNLKVYAKAGSSQDADDSINLLQRLLTSAQTGTTYEQDAQTNIRIIVAGSGSENMQIDIPKSILHVPTQQFNDILGVDIPFTAKETTNQYCSITYNI